MAHAIRCPCAMVTLNDGKLLMRTGIIPPCPVTLPICTLRPPLRLLFEYLCLSFFLSRDAFSSCSSRSPGDRSFEELALLPNGTVNEAYRPLAISQYHVHVHRWLEVFPREQLLVVNGDQLIDDPVSQLRRIEDFLGKLIFPPFLDGCVSTLCMCVYV